MSLCCQSGGKLLTERHAARVRSVVGEAEMGKQAYRSTGTEEEQRTISGTARADRQDRVLRWINGHCRQL